MLNAIVGCFQMVDIILIVVSILCDLWHRHHISSEWKQLTISKWVYYFSAVASFFLSLGFIATWEDERSKSVNDIAICVLFSLACISCIIFMIVQKNWAIKYNEHSLVFRNSWHLTRIYSLDKIILKNDGRIIRLFVDGKKIAQWDILIVNTSEDIALCKYISMMQKK